MRKVSKYITLDGTNTAFNVDLGGVPDKATVYLDLNGTEKAFHWYNALADDGKYGQYGIQEANAGDISVCSNADNGIIEYSSSSDKVLIPAPDGDGTSEASVSDFATGTDYSSTGQARSTSQLGTVVRPTSHNGYVYEATAVNGSPTAEPTWPTTPGNTVTDNASNTWICREENVIRGGGGGITVGKTLSNNASDSNIAMVEAEWHERSFAGGDVASDDPA